jgi:SlyX protein
MPTNLEARLEKLETLASYQEQAIEDLNATITRQWDEIAALKRQLGNLAERLRELSDNPALAGPPDPPPPHY